jgi:hypothetical protein
MDQAEEKPKYDPTAAARKFLGLESPEGVLGFLGALAAPPMVSVDENVERIE